MGPLFPLRPKMQKKFFFHHDDLFKNEKALSIKLHSSKVVEMGLKFGAAAFALFI